MSSAPLSQIGNWTINYTYDLLNRLTAADYSNGDYYHYTCDTTNQLSGLGGVAYTWDKNGNLVSDVFLSHQVGKWYFYCHNFQLVKLSYNENSTTCGK